MMVVVVHLPVTSFVMGVVIVGVGVKFVYYVESIIIKYCYY